MIEDKLTHDERLRLECIAQSVALHAASISTSVANIVRDAEKIEEFVSGSNYYARRI